MALSLFYLAVVLLSGMAGNVCRLRVAARRLSTETIDSPVRSTRWWNRYLFFSFWHLVVSLFSIAFMLPVIQALIDHGVPAGWLLGLYLLFCLPLTAILFAADLWLTRRCDAGKRAGRAALRRRVRGN